VYEVLRHTGRNSVEENRNLETERGSDEQGICPISDKVEYSKQKMRSDGAEIFEISEMTLFWTISLGTSIEK
jgi:hypothetical protein